ncbi:MAG TPA: hypothetical protein PLU43_06635, partial [Lachnospiraceae bacterium]|nr:hypothetical protein [Lachnospiraceae bacterium]
KPARKETKWSEAVVAPFHLHMERQEDYTLEYKMSREQFIRFMMLQSNVTVQIEEKGRSRNEVCQWFEKTTDSFWQKGEHKLYFTGYSWYITKFAE